MSLTKTVGLAALGLLLNVSPARADQVVGSSCTQDPGNIIEGTSGFAVGEYCYAITCPGPGFIPYAPYPDRFCQHVASGRIISGWEAVLLDPTGYAWPRADVEIENANDGCASPYCGQPTETSVFVRQGQGNWRYVMAVSTLAGERRIYPIVAHTYDQVLVARFQGGPPRPDPRWWSFRAFYCNEVFPFTCPWI